jgi:hypothetical protein
MQKESNEPGSVSFIGGASIEIGPSIAKLRLSTKPWPAVVTVCGIVAVLIGMSFLLPTTPHRSHLNGLSRIGEYVKRALNSQSPYASVAIAKADGSHAVLIARRGHQVSLTVFSDLSRTSVSDLCSKMEEFFSTHGVVKVENGLSTIGSSNANVCPLEFALTADAEKDVELIRYLFRNFLNADDSTSLEFTTTGL